MATLLRSKSSLRRQLVYWVNLSLSLHIQVCVPGSQSASDGPLSPQKLSLLRTILQRCPSSTGKLHQQQDVACRKVKKRDYNHICQCRNRFWGQHGERCIGQIQQYHGWFLPLHSFTHSIVFTLCILCICAMPCFQSNTLHTRGWRRITRLNFISSVVSMSWYLARCAAWVRKLETTIHGLVTNIITPISTF